MIRTPNLAILVIEDGSEGLIERTLAASELETTRVRCARTMQDATAVLERESFDLICVDLALPDAHGIATVSRLRAAAAHIPMIVFCDELDGPMAIQAVHVGAQDYLIKQKEGPIELARSVRYSLAAMGARTSLAYLAQHDPVTGLVNRSLFHDRLEHALIRAVRHSSTLAFLIVDIDDFSGLNDRFGNETADLILKESAGRMRQHIRKMDTLARSHADVFFLIAEDVQSEEGASVVARKILDAFSDPFDVTGTPVSLTVGVGMALYPGGSGDEASLIQDAGSALRMVKERGGNGVQRSGAPT